MRISEHIRHAADRRTRKRRAPSSDADSPQNYKRETGRCPPGYYVNDDTGRCEKVSPRKQKQRDRKNRKLRNYRKYRRRKHPPLSRHSEVTMKISEQIRQAENTPERIAKMLKEKLKGAEKLYDSLKSVKYMDYNIGDFFKSDLPELRKLTDRITKRKRDLEFTLYEFTNKGAKELKKLK